MSERETTIIFDLDDTLIDTSDVYWRARSRFAEELVQEGFTSDAIIELFEHLDGENLRALGHSAHRYGISMEHTAQQLLQRIGKVPSTNLLDRIKSSGEIVLNEYPSLIPGAEDLLRWASTHFQLVLLTRGEDGLQRRKAEHVGIAHYFSTIRVVETKRADTFVSLMNDVGCQPYHTWVIGDSIKSDINPGTKAGARCILYAYQHHSYVWQQEYIDIAVRPFYIANNLQIVRAILEHPEQFIPVDRIGQEGCD